jgi:hypothetical protein
LEFVVMEPITDARDRKRLEDCGFYPSSGSDTIWFYGL